MEFSYKSNPEKYFPVVRSVSIENHHPQLYAPDKEYMERIIDENLALFNSGCEMWNGKNANKLKLFSFIELYFSRKKAVKEFRKAACRGHKGAQINLAFAYLNGAGTSKDIIKAYRWYNIVAIYTEDNEAKSVINELSKDMTIKQIEKAKQIKLIYYRTNDQEIGPIEFFD